MRDGNNAGQESSWIERFPGNTMWSNATLVTKGMAPYGAIAMGEVDEVCQRLEARQTPPAAAEGYRESSVRPR